MRKKRNMHKYLPNMNVKFSVSLQHLKFMVHLSTEISAWAREVMSSALPASPTL